MNQIKRFLSKGTNILLVDILVISLAFVAAYYIFNIVDIYTFNFPWIYMLKEYGFLRMYDEWHINYPPLFPGFLYLIRDIAFNAFYNNVEMFQLVMKLFSLLSYILSTSWIYKKISPIASLFWVTNIALFVNVAIWGQADVAFGFLVVMLFYYIKEDRSIAVCIIFAFMCLLKHQGIYFVVPLLIYLFDTQKSIGCKIKSLFCGVIVGVCGWLPFIISNGFDIIFPFKVYLHAFSEDDCFNKNASNVWLFLDGIQIESNFCGLVAYILLFVCVLLMLYIYIKTKNIVISTYFYLFTIYMFTFNQHERYNLYPMFMLFVITFIEKKVKNKWLYVMLGISAGFAEAGVLISANQKFRLNYMNSLTDELISKLDYMLLTFLIASLIINIIEYIIMLQLCKNNIKEAKENSLPSDI